MDKLDGRITQEFFDKHATTLRREQDGLLRKIQVVHHDAIHAWRAPNNRAFVGKSGGDLRRLVGRSGETRNQDCVSAEVKGTTVTATLPNIGQQTLNGPYIENDLYHHTNIFHKNQQLTAKTLDTVCYTLITTADHAPQALSTPPKSSAGFHPS